MYRGMSWACVLFGLILFASAYELVRFQQSASEIIAILNIGVIGSVLGTMGLFGLWECWRKQP